MNIHFSNIKSSISNLQQELKDLANRGEKMADDLSSKFDQKRDKADARIERAIYFFLTAFLGGGFGTYNVIRGRAGGNGSPQRETELKMVTAKEGSA